MLWGTLDSLILVSHPEICFVIRPLWCTECFLFQLCKRSFYLATWLSTLCRSHAMQQLEIRYINQHFLRLAGVFHKILGYMNIDWYLIEYKLHFQIFVSKQDGCECPYTRDGFMIRPSIHLWRTLSWGWGEYLNKKGLLQWSQSS